MYKGNKYIVDEIAMECGKNYSDPIREEMQQQEMKTSGLEVKPKEAILVTLAFVLLVFSGKYFHYSNYWITKGKKFVN